MISYTVYKIIHLSSIILFFITSSQRMLGNDDVKFPKIFQGVASLFILISGMGLLARIGISHGQGWPLWAILKVIIWLIFTISAPLITKRLPKLKKIGFWAMYIVLVLTIWIINEKPV